MIVFNRFKWQLISIKSLGTSFNQQCCKNTRYMSTTKDLQTKEFRKKTEHFSFNSDPNNNADIFGTLTENTGTNQKLNSLPPEDDDVVRYDKGDKNKRLHISEYHKIIQELIKQHKVKKLEYKILSFVFYIDDLAHLQFLDCRCYRCTRKKNFKR